MMDREEIAICKQVLASKTDATVASEAREMMVEFTPFELACLSIITRNETMDAWRALDRLRSRVGRILGAIDRTRSKNGGTVN